MRLLERLPGPPSLLASPRFSPDSDELAPLRELPSRKPMAEFVPLRCCEPKELLASEDGAAVMLADRVLDPAFSRDVLAD